MCIRSIIRKVSGLHGLVKRNRGEPRQDPSHIRHRATKKYQRSPIPHRMSCCFEQVCFESHRQVSTFLQSPQEGIRMDGRVSKDFPRPERLSHNSSVIKSVCARRRVVPILSGVPTCRKFSSNQRERKSTKTCVLH